MHNVPLMYFNSLFNQLIKYDEKTVPLGVSWPVPGLCPALLAG